MRSWLCAIALAVCMSMGAAHAQERTHHGSTITIDDAAWLVGRWTGEGFGGELEEIWAAPVGDQMVGLFRMTRDGQPVFYEFLLIEEHEGGLRYRVKHFNPDLVGWEEKDRFHEFPWMSGDRNELRFEGLILRRIGEDRSDHILTMRSGDGAEREETLHYRRVRD